MSTKSTDTKTVLIAYHANCIDGFTSAWACHKGVEAMADNIELLPVSYDNLGNLAELAATKDMLYVVDFSLSLDLLAELQGKVAVTIIDHHKTAKERYEGNTELYGAEIVMDMDECGATLVWKYFFPTTPVPMLLEYVRDYDLWRFDLRSTKAINYFLRLQEQSIYEWSHLIESLGDNEFTYRALEAGRAIDTYRNQIVDDLCEGAEVIELAGEKGFSVNCPSVFASDVGHELAIKSGTYGATWQQVQGKVKFSLRSDREHGDFDVSALAANFGGGGHKNAAGFTLSSPQEGKLFPDEEGSDVGVTLWRV